jgi:flagellar biosynthetic protein FliQ
VSPEVLVSFVREALWLVLLASLPPLGASLLVGFLSGFFQAATQIQEGSLAVVPKLLAAAAALGLAGPWIAERLARFTSQLLLALPGAGAW